MGSILKYLFITVAALFCSAAQAEAMTLCVNQDGEKVFVNTYCPGGFVPATANDRDLTALHKKDKPTDANLCIATEIYKKQQLEGVNVFLERAECFVRESTKGNTAKNHYIALLLTVKNNSPFKLYGGQSKYSYCSNSSGKYCHTYSVITDKGSEIEAQHAITSFWKNRLMVWDAEEIEAGDTQKGWVVFNIPKDSSLRQFVFNINKIERPFTYTHIGSLKIPL